MSARIGLFYIDKSRNCIYYIFILKFLCTCTFFAGWCMTQKFLPNTNNFNAVVWFQGFVSYIDYI